MADNQGTQNVYQWPRASDTTSGSGGGGYEARLAKLESDVGHIHGDIREIKTDLRALLYGGLAVITIIVGGFFWMVQHMDSRVAEILNRLP